MLGLFFCGPALGAEIGFPPPRGAVNDFAGIIDAASVQTMENLSREVLEKTGTSIVVAVLASIGDNDPDDYANRLYQAWGIGEKGKDKGVLIFLALKERKVRIETGYGVEGILPDGLAGEILDKYVLPDLKAGQYGQGLDQGRCRRGIRDSEGCPCHPDGGAVPCRRPAGSGVPAGHQSFRGDPDNYRSRSADRHEAGQGIVALPHPDVDERRRPGQGGSGGFGGGGFGGFGGGFSGGGGASRDF